VKLLLDEMWTTTIARELRKRGLDVVTISEPACAGRYAGVSDDAVFVRAQADGRTIVTDNVADFELARRDWESRGRPHHGIVYATDPPFNRHRGERVIGQMVTALAQLLSSSHASDDPFNQTHFLRET
jgi:predicted nuclease of predicted toxin-antitoxin system